MGKVKGGEKEKIPSCRGREMGYTEFFNSLFAFSLKFSFALTKLIFPLEILVEL